MPEQPRAGGLDAETLAAYLEGQLPPESRAKVEAEIASDPEAYEWVVHALRTMDETREASGSASGSPAGAAPAVAESPAGPEGAGPGARPIGGPVVRPFIRRRGVQAAIGAALAAAAALVMVIQLQPDWWRRISGNTGDPRFEKLVAAVGEERYIEGRLTGGFQYGPLRSVTRGPGDLSNQNLALLAAAGELQKAAEADPSAENLHAWGVAALLLGDLDAGVRALEEASRMNPSAAQVLNALAAGYLARASTQDRPDDLPRALATAERAIAADSGLLEAKFNRALALEHLNLIDQARQAWLDYASLDTTEWGDEARRRAARLVTSRLSDQWESALAAAERDDLEPAHLFALSAERTLPIVEIAWPARWAESHSQGDVREADRWLNRLSRAGQALATLTGDESVSRLTQRITRLESGDRGAAARALILYREAHNQLERYRFDDGARTLAEALPELAGPGHPYQAQALLAYASALRSSRRIEDARRVMARTKVLALSPLDEGRSERLYGLIALARGDYVVALQHYERAMDRFDHAGLHVTGAQTATLVSEALNAIGSPESWRYQVSALRLKALGADPAQLQPVYFVAGTMALKAAQPEAAASFFSAMVAEAEATGNPAAIAEAKLNLARALTANGRGAEADSVLAAALALLEPLPPTAHTAFVRGEWELFRAETLLGRDPSRALVSARRALDHAIGSTRAAIVPRAYLAVGRALEVLEGAASAEPAYRMGVEALEAQLDAVGDSDARLSMLDGAWSLYEALAAAQAGGEGRSAEALITLERARIRSIAPARAPDGWSGTRLGARLRPDAAVVYWLPTSTRSLAWVVRREGIQLHEVPVSSTEIASAFAGTSSDRHSQARQIAVGARLLAPLTRSLSGCALIGMVAPGLLSRLPWALVPMADQVRLVDRAAVALVPSGYLLTERSMPSERDGRVLVIAADRDVSDGGRLLPPLPRALDEARAVSTLYDRATLLTGAEVTPGAVLAGLGGYDVLHFAGHAIANEENPALSRLVLPRGQVLFAKDVARIDASRLQLAVLTACETATGAVSQGDGAISLARALVGAGVLSVIAANGTVADEEAARFGVALHQRLAAGLSPMVAMWRTQQALSVDPGAGHWSRFVFVGGSELMM